MTASGAASTKLKYCAALVMGCQLVSRCMQGGRRAAPARGGGGSGRRRAGPTGQAIRAPGAALLCRLPL